MTALPLVGEDKKDNFFPNESKLSKIVCLPWVLTLNVRKMILVDDLFAEEVSAFEYFIVYEVLALLCQFNRAKK